VGHLVAISVAADHHFGRGSLVCPVFVFPYFALRNHFRRNPDAGRPTTYTFSAAGIDILKASLQSHLSWESIRRVLETSSWLLLFPDAFPMPTIPKRYLGDADQQAKLRTMVRAHVKHVRLQG